MWSSERSVGALYVLLVAAVLFASLAALAVYQQRALFARAGARIISGGNPAYDIQRGAIISYARSAQRIQRDFGAKRISRDEATRRALALHVPPVLKERHLQWVTALRTKRDGAAAVIIQEYTWISEPEL